MYVRPQGAACNSGRDNAVHCPKLGTRALRHEDRKSFPASRRSDERRFHACARRSPCAARRERRRQVDADQVPDRRLSPRRRHASTSTAPRSIRATRSRRSGSASAPSIRRSTSCPTCRWRENLYPRPPADALRPGRCAARCTGAPKRCWRTTASISTSGRAARQLFGRRAAGRGDRPRRRSLRQGADPRRADREPRRARGRTCCSASSGELKARGLGIVFITHFLEQVYAISDRITVLRNGRLVGTPRDGASLRRGAS